MSLYKKHSNNSVAFFKDILKSKLSRISERKQLRGSALIKSLISAELDEKQYYTNTYVLDIDKSNVGKLHYLIEILESYGMKRSSDTSKKHMFGIIRDNYYETYFYIINNFENISSFANLFGLYSSLNIFYSEFYQANYPLLLPLSSNTKLSDLNNKAFTIHSRKQDLQHTQHTQHIYRTNIFNVYNDETLSAAKELLSEEYGSNGIYLTEYKTNLMTYKGLKMYLRAYMLFTLINNTFKSFLFDKGQIITARETYKNDDWNNPNIHNVSRQDANSQSTNLIFPDDLYGNTKSPNIKSKKEFDLIWNKCRETVKIISTIVASNIYNYANTINSFQIFEIDISITNESDIFIANITTENKLSNKYANNLLFPDIESLDKSYFNWIHEIVIKPCLFPNLEANTGNTQPATIPIYEIEYADF